MILQSFFFSCFSFFVFSFLTTNFLVCPPLSFFYFSFSCDFFLPVFSREKIETPFRLSSTLSKNARRRRREDFPFSRFFPLFFFRSPSLSFSFLCSLLLPREHVLCLLPASSPTRKKHLPRQRRAPGVCPLLQGGVARGEAPRAEHPTRKKNSLRLHEAGESFRFCSLFCVMRLYS